MKQFMLELDALEKAIAVERDNQLRKMRQRLIKKKIETERLKKEEQQEIRVLAVKKQIGKYLLVSIQNARKRAEESKNIKKIAVQPTAPMTNALARQKTIDNAINAKDKLRLLLQQWSERVKDKDDDQQQIWEKRTADFKLDSPKSSMSKMSKMVGLKSGVMPLGQSPANNYTMEELMRRIRRIEKLTDNMSQGQF